MSAAEGPAGGGCRSTGDVRGSCRRPGRGNGSSCGDRRCGGSGSGGEDGDGGQACQQRWLENKRIWKKEIKGTLKYVEPAVLRLSIQDL